MGCEQHCSESLAVVAYFRDTVFEDAYFREARLSKRGHTPGTLADILCVSHHQVEMTIIHRPLYMLCLSMDITHVVSIRSVGDVVHEELWIHRNAPQFAEYTHFAERNVKGSALTLTSKLEDDLCS